MVRRQKRGDDCSSSRRVTSPASSDSVIAQRSFIASSTSASDSKAKSETPTGQPTPIDTKIFIGARKASSAVRGLQPSDFVLYYRIPEGRVPFKVQLFLAYMSSTRSPFHFPVTCEYNKQTGTPLWSLRDISRATFSTLEGLIRYHRIYSYVDPNTGAMETFPVWKGVIIDSDCNLFE